MLGSSYLYQFIFELSTKRRNGCSIYTVGRKNSFGIMTCITILLLFECSDHLQKTSLQSIFVMIYSTCAAFDRHDISKIRAIVNVSAHAEEVGISNKEHEQSILQLGVISVAFNIVTWELC